MGFVHSASPHTHISRGDVGMEYKQGNTIIKIHSHVAEMSQDEQKEFWENEKWKENPILKQIDKAILDCYRR